jgi:hypothetical protein
MSDNKKSIKINPSFFSVSGGKTRKASKEKKAPAIIPPLVSPNLLKKKLIQRLKENKNKEIKSLEPKKTEFSSVQSKPLIDEFNDSINYLQSLSNKSSAEARKSELQRRTLKRHFSELEGITPTVSLDLPDELSSFNPSLSEGSLQLNKKLPSNVQNDVPYGVLKQGNKPTFRQYYNRTLKSTPSILLSDSTPKISFREQKLNNLKKKLEEMKHRKALAKTITEAKEVAQKVTDDSLMLNNNNSSDMLSSSDIVSLATNELPSLEESIVDQNFSLDKPLEVVSIDLDEIRKKAEEAKEQEKALAQPVKQILKKTIKREYTLGKCKDKRKVSVLLKNRATRKKVLDACKKIKQEDIKDVKEYLRNHNFIKTGTNAPNHVLREMFESVMLTGEMINTNSETMMFNFSRS